MTTPPQAPQRSKGKPFAQMNRRQKFVFVLKLAISILTFGIAFPNVMTD